MLGVVTLHSLGRSGILYSEIKAQYRAAWFLEIAVYGSVNCFAMITGFLSYSDSDRKTKHASFINTWIEVVFYGALVSIFMILIPGIHPGIRKCVSALFPLLTGQYWYFSVYAGVFVLGRFINFAVRSADNKTLIAYVVGIFLYFSVMESVTIVLNDEYTLSNLLKGYSFAWLLLMYIIGAVVRKTGIYRGILFTRTISVAVLCIILSYVWMICIGPVVENGVIGKNWKRLFVQYTSPTIVIAAFCMLCVFANLKCPFWLEKLAAFLAPRTFSIYLLNSQPLIAAYLINKNNLAFLLRFSGVRLLAVTIGFSVGFSIICIMIDSFRIILFHRLKINELSLLLGSRISGYADRFGNNI